MIKLVGLPSPQSLLSETEADLYLLGLSGSEPLICMEATGCLLYLHSSAVVNWTF